MRGILTSVILLSMIMPALASAQGGISRLKKNLTPAERPSVWQSALRYSVLSDYADNRTPRAYTHSVLLGTSYNFSKTWSLDAAFAARAEVIDGQIEKGREQTYDETLGPSTSMALNYGASFYGRHSYGFYLEGEPLWDQASRLEGYKGLIGIGGKVSFAFFKKYYTMSHDLSVSELLNSYKYGSNLLANPDIFYTYKFSNVVKVYKGLRASYTFGAKVTKYMDDFTGYSYSNSIGLSYTWPNYMAGISYENGGFTDQGEISLWYIDQYRRLARLVVGYTF